MTDHTNDRPERPTRGHKISIRVDDSELENLKARAGDQALAEWMRNVCMGQPEKPAKRKAYSKKEIKRWTPPPAVDPNLIRHIAMIGNNINQIARVLNRNPNADTMAVLIEIQHIQNALDKIVEINSVSQNHGG